MLAAIPGHREERKKKRSEREGEKNAGNIAGRIDPLWSPAVVFRGLVRPQKRRGGRAGRRPKDVSYLRCPFLRPGFFLYPFIYSHSHIYERANERRACDPAHPRPNIHHRRRRRRRRRRRPGGLLLLLLNRGWHSADNQLTPSWAAASAMELNDDGGC